MDPSSSTIPAVTERWQELPKLAILSAKAVGANDYFENLATPFMVLRRVFEKLSDVDFSRVLKRDHYNLLDSYSLRFMSILRGLDQLSYPADKGTAREYELLVNFSKTYEDFCNELMPAVPEILAYGTVSQSVEARDVLESAKNSKAEIDNILSDFREGLTKQFVIENAAVFEAESIRHSKSAVWWRIAGILIALLLITYGVMINRYLLITHPLPKGLDILPYALAHASVVVILVYLMSVSFRNHSTHKHNDVINRHHYNALRTFKYIVDASPDDATKGAILQTLATSIFTVQDSGYLSNGGDTIQISAVADAIKGAVK